ncbi:hypothetical protein LX77_00929 [Gelidibacter algens]|uniref:Uncharacterized protein n=2 Tax=Gelidibacter algens TaxID=49280 RepID=A0A327SFG1_9FLAO|nr:hypothetical protein LX77_00929 [Gelidibacter algens]
MQPFPNAATSKMNNVITSIPVLDLEGSTIDLMTTFKIKVLLLIIYNNAFELQISRKLSNKHLENLHKECLSGWELVPLGFEI